MIEDTKEFKALSDPAQTLFKFYIGHSSEDKVIYHPMQTDAFQELLDNHYIIYVSDRYILIDNIYIYNYILYVLSLLNNNINKDISIPFSWESNFLFDRKESLKEKKGFPSSAKTVRFVPPTLDEVKAYCSEHSLNVNPERFLDYYESVGWMVGGKTKMKDWKAACRNWSARESAKPSEKPKTQNKSFDTEEFFRASLLKGNFNE